METHKLERLFEAFYKKRLSSLEFACDGSPLNCMNSNELAVLRALSSEDQLVMSRLSEITGLAMSTLTGITDKLSGLGLIERRRDAQDRRIVRVFLSPEGRAAYKIRTEAKNEVCRDILSPLSEDEEQLFLRLLEKITES